jgi:hypothetical protein
MVDLFLGMAGGNSEPETFLTASDSGVVDRLYVYVMVGDEAV